MKQETKAPTHIEVRGARYTSGGQIVAAGTPEEICAAAGSRQGHL